MRRSTLALLPFFAACAPALEGTPLPAAALAAAGVDAHLAATAAVDPASLGLDQVRPGRLLVGFAGVAPTDSLPLAAGTARRINPDSPLPVGVYELPEGSDLAAAAETLKSLPGVAFVEADLVRTAASTGDPHRGLQWHFDAIDLETATATGADGTGAVVAVLDTGVSAAGGDTPTGLVVGWDFVDGDADATDLHGHGTHVAGTIAQATNNGYQGAGIAPGARILPVRVLDADGSGYTSDIIDGIVWAVDNGAQVLNLSLGSNTSSASELLAVEWAVEQGALVVAASGNNYGATVSFPAGYEAALAVGATDAANARAPYSNRGNALDLVAPGGDLNADLNADGYGDGVLQESFSGSEWGGYFFQGTSMAAPHVAGVAALLIGEGATAAEAEEILLDTALDLGAEGWDSATGVGLLDAGEALSQWLSREPGDGGDDGMPSEEPEGPEETEPETDDEEPGDDAAPVDLTAPEVLYEMVSQEGASVRIVIRTDEPSALRVCTRARRCISTGLDTLHMLQLEPEARRLRLSVTDASGNRRRLPPVVLDEL